MRYVNIFDDEQYSHRDIDLGTTVPTKNGVLQVLDDIDLTARQSVCLGRFTSCGMDRDQEAFCEAIAEWPRVADTPFTLVSRFI